MLIIKKQKFYKYKLVYLVIEWKPVKQTGVMKM